MLTRNYVPALLALLILQPLGCAEAPRTAQPGDQILVDYTCRLTDNSLVESTLAQVAGNEGAAKSPIFLLRDSYRPFAFTVPSASEPLATKPFDPIELKIGASIANLAAKLPLERTTRVELVSTEIENFPARDRYLEMALSITMPRNREMPIDEFKARYGAAAPVVGAAVGEETEYPGIIRAVSEDMVTIYFSAREGAKMPGPLTTATLRAVDEETFEARMDVQKGQLIKRLGGLAGRVSAIDDKTFTVDYAQSFGGETLVCDVTLKRQNEGPTAKSTAIDWVESFDQAIARAREQHKPVVLMLYSDQCPHCHQMLDKVIPDPALDSYRDGFVWLKINSEKQTEYADRFQQQGYPLTLVLDANASELKRLSGLQHIATLAHTLDTVLAAKKKS